MPMKSIHALIAAALLAAASPLPAAAQPVEPGVGTPPSQGPTLPPRRAIAPPAQPPAPSPQTAAAPPQVLTPLPEVYTAPTPRGRAALGPSRYGWNLSGGETLRFFRSPSEQACHRECENNSACQAYTWVKPGGYQPNDPPVCYLMRSYKAASRHRCCVSATRGPFPIIPQAAAADRATCLDAGKTARHVEACLNAIRSGAMIGEDAGQAFANLGAAYLRQGQFDLALTALDDAIRRLPQNAGAYVNRAAAWFGQCELDRAITDDIRAIRIDANFALAYNNRAIALAAKGELDQALADYNRALQRDPKLVVAYSNRAAIFAAKGDYDRALADLDRALQLAPNSAKALAGRGSVWHAKGDDERALVDYERAIQLDPKLAAALAGRAGLRESKGDDDGARNDYLAALEREPRQTEWRNSVVRLQQKVEQTRAASLAPVVPPAEVLRQHGLLGVWAQDCAQRPGRDNVHDVFRPAGNEVRNERSGGASVTPVETVVSADELSAATLLISQQSGDGVGVDYVVEIDGNRRRTTTALDANGQAIITAGRRVDDGSEVPWLSRCER